MKPMHGKILVRLIVMVIGLSLSIAACNAINVQLVASPTPTNITSPTEKIAVTSPSPSATRAPTETPSPLPTRTPTRTPTATLPPTGTETPLPTITPTYAILRARVLEQSNCRYGPGAAYLYKYGLYPGFNIEVIGRNETGTWVVIQAIGGNNPCWVKASLLAIKGEVTSLAPMSLPLPESPYYGPLTGAWAVRDGDKVIISWDPLNLRAGDDSLQYPYLVEAWLCQGGQLIFAPIGSWETMITVKDEAGCTEPSHARLYGVEKHGYTAWVNIPWPQP